MLCADASFGHRVELACVSHHDDPGEWDTQARETCTLMLAEDGDACRPAQKQPEDFCLTLLARPLHEYAAVQGHDAPLCGPQHCNEQEYGAGLCERRERLAKAEV